MGSYGHLLFCESISEERSAGNPHAAFCGSRMRVTAFGDPVGLETRLRSTLNGHEGGNPGHGQGQSYELPRQSFTRQSMFQELEAHLHSEVNTLGYPKAALFGFCVALVAYNVLAVVKAALRTLHGEAVIDNELSGYYLAGNITRTYDGMMIALPESEWEIFQTLPQPELVDLMLQLAANVNLSKLRKSPRGPKKKTPKRNKYSNHPHVSTAKLLAGEKPHA
jgi:hypothetical protein